MRQKFVVVLLACVCALIGSFAASADNAGAPEPTDATADFEQQAQPSLSQEKVQRIVDVYRRATWHWQRVMGRRVTLTLRRQTPEPVQRIQAWKRVATYTRWLASRPPHLYAWTCIHRYEAAWTDAGAPYYGGLQMDLGFQRRYGAYLLRNKGTAERWSPLEQMWVAERAYRAGRGYYPWPNTARACGLL
jgi:hypothetical protein